MLKVGIGVFAAGVALAVAIPLAQRAVRETRATEVVEELRHFAQVFQAHAKQRGDWPPAATSPGQIPPGMENVLDASWSQRTPIGGRYLWAPDSLHRARRYRATIAFARANRDPVNDDRQLLEEIDRQIDNGDLSSGTFQLGYRNQPFFVVEP